MGLFSCCFSQSTPKVGAESKPAIQKLQQWETTHFPVPRMLGQTDRQTQQLGIKFTEPNRVHLFL